MVRFDRRGWVAACVAMLAMAGSVHRVRAADDAKPGWLGVQISDLEDDVREQNKVPADTGVKIDDVVAGGAAEMAGLKPDDIVTQVDGKPAPMVEGFVEMIGSKHAGDKIELTILRDKEEKKISVVLGERPE